MTTHAEPETLADLRKKAGLSQDQVADRMGITKARVRHIEAKYPGINYGTLARYIQALGGSIQFLVGTTHTSADRLKADPDKSGTRAYLSSRPGMGNLVYKPSGTEELVLQGQQPDTGDNDTGGQVDHADAQSDQGDSGQGQ